MRILNLLGGIEGLESAIKASNFQEMAGSPGVEFRFVVANKSGHATIFWQDMAPKGGYYVIELRKSVSSSEPYDVGDRISEGDLRKEFYKMVGVPAPKQG
jgi:hypothetical protein